MITISAVVLLHLGVIAVLVGVNGCRTTSGFEKPGDLSAYTGAPGVGAGASAAAPAPAGLNEAAPAAAPAAPRASKVGHGGTYTVVRGDSLWLVARREGVNLGALAAANGIEVNAVLREGQKLTIPSADAVAPAPRASTAAPANPASPAAPAAPAPRGALAAPEGGFGGFGTSAPAAPAPAAPAPAPEAPAPAAPAAAPAPAAPAAAPAPSTGFAAPEGGFGGFGSGAR